MTDCIKNYLLNQKVQLFQSAHKYKTSSDAVLLASMVHKLKKGAKILDVGSGTGSVSLCLAYRFPDADITGFEIQDELVEVSNMSAEVNQFKNLKYICYDINNKKPPYSFCSFDCVITNPPYLTSGTKSPNMSKAIAHNGENITLQEWLAFCIKMLKPFGELYLIDKAEKSDEILSILYQKTGNITVLPIYSKQGQKAKRVIIRAQKDSKAGVNILPPLIIHNENGHTPQADQILRGGKSYFEIDFSKT